MANVSLRKWATVVRNAFQELKFMPPQVRPQPVVDPQHLADVLLHIGQQLSRVRIEYIARAISDEQLQALSRHKLKEAARLLRKAALPDHLPRSMLAECVLRALEDWEHAARAAWERSLQVADLRGLEHRLETLADALVAYAVARNEQWCDTQPSL
jgi:hypothetical protein